MSALLPPNVEQLHQSILAELKFRSPEATRAGAAAFQPTVWTRHVWQLWPGIITDRAGWALGFVGDPRTGKDFALRYAGAMRTLLDDKPWQSYRVSQLAMMADLFGQRKDAYEIAQWDGTLILSDLADESERSIAYVRDLFDIRYDRRLKTLVSTNASIPTLEERYGKKFTTRIGDGGHLIEEPDAKVLIAKPKPASIEEIADHFAGREAERKAQHEAWLARERANEVDISAVTPEQVEEMKRRIRDGNLLGDVGHSLQAQEYIREPMTYAEQVEHLRRYELETNSETVSNENQV